MHCLINIENVYKNYYLGNTSFSALENINFKVQAGEMTAVMGASGSGKSTLMNIIGFLDKATSGRYFFADEDVSSLSLQALATIRNKKIGFIFQAFFLLLRSTALQNVMLPLFYYGTPPLLAKEKAMHELEKMSIAHLAQHKPHQLSGGQQQRIAIARALVNSPDVILADEPTGALDSKTGNEVMMLLQKLNQDEGRTIIIITHDQNVSNRCSRIVTIRDGKIIEDNKR